MQFQYCPHCGTKLTQRPMGDEGDVPYCEGCEMPLFDVFSTCVIVLVVNEAGEAALLRQGYISHQYYNLVSGYIKPGENAEETARREVAEELGVSVTGLEPAGTYWFGKKDMLMLGYFAQAEKQALTLSGEVDAARWVPLRDALGLVHPEGSVSHALVDSYMKKHQLYK